jgi:hypothetical protein
MTFHTLRQDTESHAMFMASGDRFKAAFFRQDAIESPSGCRHPIFMGCCGARR